MPPPSRIPEDGGCYDASIDCGYQEVDSGSYSESPWMYGSSGDAYAGRCRTAWARRTRKNLFGGVQWRYIQQVRWCWNGLIVTWFYRNRFPADTAYGWTFDGHVASNCLYEHCYPGRWGHASESAWTQGKFHVCVKWICLYKYPAVSITVYANGTYAYATTG